MGAKGGAANGGIAPLASSWRRSWSGDVSLQDK